MKEISPCSNSSESEVSLASTRPPHLVGWGVSDRQEVGEHAGSLLGRGGGNSRLEAGVRGLCSLLGRPTCLPNAPPQAPLGPLNSLPAGMPGWHRCTLRNPREESKEMPKTRPKENDPPPHTHTSAQVSSMLAAHRLHPFSLSSPYPSSSLFQNHLSSLRPFSPSSE